MNLETKNIKETSEIIKEKALVLNISIMEQVVNYMQAGGLRA